MVCFLSILFGFYLLKQREEKEENKEKGSQVEAFKKLRLRNYLSSIFIYVCDRKNPTFSHVWDLLLIGVSLIWFCFGLENFLVKKGKMPHLYSSSTPFT